MCDTGAAFAVPFCFEDGVPVKKTCPICGRIVDRGHRHIRKVSQKGRKYPDTEQRKIRSSIQWQRKRDEIKERDCGVDQVAIHGLDGSPYVMAKDLQVHHIEPIEERPDLAFDNTNLITVSPRTHELCESGKIDRQTLHDIAEKNEKRFRKGTPRV